MSDEKRRSIRIELTAEQKKQIKEASGEEVSSLEFTAEQLEQRIAPIYLK
jgi:DNA-binding MarR family transcriptional regulator